MKCMCFPPRSHCNACYWLRWWFTGMEALWNNIKIKAGTPLVGCSKRDFSRTCRLQMNCHPVGLRIPKLRFLLVHLVPIKATGRLLLCQWQTADSPCTNPMQWGEREREGGPERARELHLLQTPLSSKTLQTQPRAVQEVRIMSIHFSYPSRFAC